MEKIKFTDIDFSVLYRLEQQGSNATLYRKGQTCIKILDKYQVEERDKLYRKLLDMDGLDIEGVLLPKTLIVQNDRLQGYIMDYFPNSRCLSQQFATRFVETRLVMQYVLDASKILRNIHQNGVIFQDLSFENILVDKYGKVVFCDIDGCKYQNHDSSFISLLMKNFFIDYRDERIYVCENLDRISMMLSFFYLIYEEEIQHLSRRRYDRLSKSISTLENLKSYFNGLKDIRKPIGEVPYLDELIDLNDHVIFDRDKQLRLRDRILGRC